MSELQSGPIDYLAVEFPGGKLRGDGLRALIDLVDRQIIRVLDLRVARVAEDGSVSGVVLTDLDQDGDLDLIAFQGVESGLLGDDDIAEAAGLIEPGNAVALLVYENTWAEPFVTAMHEAGAQVISSGRIPADQVNAALSALAD